ncbi:MAG: (d)CMP kinase [Gemmataceae bacterium]|nr:(d)CMP kinase [Gemmataceae bacterium]
MIVTIDGPAGAGKSSAAKMLARRLGFDFLDTGAMYRAVTLAALRANGPLDDEAYLTSLLHDMRLDLPAGHVMLNGEDVTGLIRTPQVTASSGKIADSRVVRTQLVKRQREIAAGRDIVCEGRDQGTLVFPNAEAKFFLEASDEERAERRHRELQAKGEAITFEEILDSQRRRDARDACRDIAPMKAAPDAIRIDSTAMSLENVVRMMEEIVRTRAQASE